MVVRASARTSTSPSPFGNTISLIIQRSADKKVVGINAPRVVTLMA